MTTEMPFIYLDAFDTHDLPPLSVAVGVMDGVHRGHQALLAAAVESAYINGTLPAVLTFDPHPSTVLAPHRAPLLLGTLDERVQLLRKQGASAVIVLRFDRAMAAQTPEAFVQEILIGRLNAKTVIIGDDFRFGCDRKGNAEYLRTLGDRLGFTLRTVAAVSVNGVPARSSVIRQCLIEGNMAQANTLLGRSYSLSGTVVHGRKLGRTLGYPTANLESAHAVLIPGAGVYAGYALVDGQKHRAAISIGTNPTVTQSGVRTVEAFLMDGFTGDLYDKPMVLEFVALLRPTLKFDNWDALIVQMATDVRDAERRLPSP